MKIRNEEFLQNYSPSWFRMILSGKDFNPLIGRDDRGALTDVNTWITIFDHAIEDLQKGLHINNKAGKNGIDYWLKQKRLLNEFINKED